MMSFTTPTRPLESSAKRLLKRVNVCTERSFERTPIRYAISKRKTIEILSSTMSSGITLLSNDDQTLVGDHTISNDSLLSLDRTLTEDNHEKNKFNETTITTTWEIIDSIDNNSDFSIITLNQSDVSQATVISKRSTKTSIRPSSLLARVLKLSMPKPSTSVKYINRHVRDIDRLNDTFGQEWITLPNFV
ncbi:unnamed protein product [Rotaria sp. Silwood1]|nr:unnamed protein product [Rotaria sp. Silwood1]CAF0765335.1 unnamed protein product [Rotaria sp. Silwood1]CAF3339955.1 unnamed protein product [Rotaria sp. Silwood1]CAF4663146.1 unnamed protein product [Rotaria sp. Silwood1]